MLKLGFALSVLALVAVSIWTVIDDASPEWRGEQARFRSTQIDRWEAAAAAARELVETPEVEARLEELDSAIAAQTAPDSPASRRGRDLRSGLDRLRADIQLARDSLRQAQDELGEPRRAERIGRTRISLRETEAAIARLTGTWPPDSLGLARVTVRRDSLAAELDTLQSPVRSAERRLAGLREEGAALLAALSEVSAARDSLQRLRNEIVAPVARAEAILGRLREMPPGVVELRSAGGAEVARCPTCHGTLLEPPGAHPELPAAEVFAELPCTVCHRGQGRALTRGHAHEGMLVAAGHGAGPGSLEGRIRDLLHEDPVVRHAAQEELKLLTGLEPALGEDPGTGTVPEHQRLARAWSRWWDEARFWFDLDDVDSPDGSALSASGVDPWLFTTRGRPLRYTGSADCLRCHETTHPDHVERWRHTKDISFARLSEEVNPEPCYECHATGWDPRTGGYVEAGVTCEGCHGPGERYSAMMRRAQELLDIGRVAEGNALMSHGSRLARESISRRMVPGDTGPLNVCVGCHHPKRHENGGPTALEREDAVAASTPGDGHDDPEGDRDE